jgi:hypothetical protein
VGGHHMAFLSAFLVSVALSSTAHAADMCRGSAPTAGAVVHGPVLAILDDETLCLGKSGPASGWVRAPLGRISAKRSALMAAAYGKNATCVFKPGGEAECTIEGEPLTAVLRRPEVAQTAAAWR